MAIEKGAGQASEGTHKKDSTDIGKTEQQAEDASAPKSADELAYDAAVKALFLKLEKDKTRTKLKFAQAVNKLEDANHKRISKAAESLAPLERALDLLDSSFAGKIQTAQANLKTANDALEAAETASKKAKSKLDDLTRGRREAERLQKQGDIQKDINLIKQSKSNEDALFKLELDALEAEKQAELARLEAAHDEEIKKL